MSWNSLLSFSSFVSFLLFPLAWHDRISVRNSPTRAVDDSFSSNLERVTVPPDDAASVDLQRSDTDGLVYKVQGLKGEFGPERCDVKCEFTAKTSLVGPVFVYGTDWSIAFSLEGEVRRLDGIGLFLV